ncbi:MAG: hypothetical protein R2795_13925 [Saprospiraceae bacterium]
MRSECTTSPCLGGRSRLHQKRRKEVLDWSTEIELQNKGFEVQRALEDGISFTLCVGSRWPANGHLSIHRQGSGSRQYLLLLASAGG